jgi:hypothetical protein
MKTTPMKINIASKLLSPVVKGSCRSAIGVIAAMLIMRLLVLPANAQGSGSLERDAENVSRAVKDLEAANTFSQVQTAIGSHETVWKDRSTVAVLDYILAIPSLASDIRWLRQLERELALNYQRYGRETAAQLYLDRILAAQSVQQSGSEKQGGSNTSTFEDRAADSIIKSGQSIPDGLITSPVYP